MVLSIYFIYDTFDFQEPATEEPEQKEDAAE